MDPSVIFAIAAGAIIIIGRIINRIAEKSDSKIEDTTHSLDAQHHFDGEEAIPARQNDNSATLTGSILAQILAEKHRREISEREISIPIKQTRTPKVQKKNKEKTQPKTNTQPKATSIICNDNSSTTDIIEDFDLQKAVIYTEILKPKFDE